MWGPLLAVVGAGLVAVVALAYWADLQHWMAGVLARAKETLGPVGYVLQSALVVVDKIMVNGQRIIAATGIATFNEPNTTRIVVHEEVRQLDPQALPADVLAKLDKGQSMSYDITAG